MIRKNKKNYHSIILIRASILVSLEVCLEGNI